MYYVYLKTEGSVISYFTVNADEVLVDHRGAAGPNAVYVLRNGNATVATVPVDNVSFIIRDDQPQPERG